MLASGSPQRRALLAALGLEFEVVVPAVEEERAGDPRRIVIENAQRKALAAAKVVGPGATIIAGDTEVALEGHVLGQPVNEDDARAHLESLSGRTHEVLGAIAILGPREGEQRGAVAISRVRFRRLDEEMISSYLASGEWRGRAGSYAVQGLGSALVEVVEGDLSNVIGLPVPLLFELAPEIFGARGHLRDREDRSLA